MEDTKKEDMSTEQILSSIRNILTDENSENASPSEDEEVFDLSEVAALSEGEPLVEEKQIETTEIPEISEPKLESEEDVFDLSPVMVIHSTSEDKTEALTPEEEPYDLSEQADEEVYDLTGSQKIEEEPSSDDEPKDVFELGTEKIVEQAEPLEPLANAVGAEAGIETKAQAEAEPEERKSVSSDVETLGTEKAVVEPVEYSEAEKSVAIEPLEVEPPVLEDVASNILSAFSNIFNNYTPEKKIQPQRVSSAYENNELKAAVQKTIESWVVKNIDADLNIKGIVNEEIALQVRVWLDENLPNLIQSSINQELERVMVKVDKAQ